MITKKFLIIEKLFCKIINYKKMHKEKMTKFIIILNFGEENFKNKLNELKEFDFVKLK